MMIGRAATGLSRLDEHVRAHTPAADERPRQGRGDPCAAAPAGGPATQSGQARVHAERPHAAGRAPAPPPHPEATAAPPADASGHYPALAPRAAEPTPRRDLRAEAKRTTAHRTLHPRSGPAPRPRERVVGLQEDPLGTSPPSASKSPPPPSGRSSRNTASNPPPGAHKSPGPPSSAPKPKPSWHATSSRPEHCPGRACMSSPSSSTPPGASGSSAPPHTPPPHGPRSSRGTWPWTWRTRAARRSS